MTTATTGSATTSSINIDKLVFRIAGVFVLASAALSYFHSIYWLWFIAFVGFNMFQASFTGFCPMATILHKLGAKPGSAFSCGVNNQ